MERKLLSLIAISVDLNFINRNMKYSLSQQDTDTSIKVADPYVSASKQKNNTSSKIIKANLPVSKGNFIQSQIDGRDDAAFYSDDNSSGSEEEIDILRARNKRRDYTLSENILLFRNDLLIHSIPKINKKLDSEEYNYIIQSANEIILSGTKHAESNSQFLNYILDAFDLYESIDKLIFINEIIRKYRKGTYCFYFMFFIEI